MKLLLFCILSLLSFTTAAKEVVRWDAVSQELYQAFESMALPPWNLSYVENMAHIQSADLLEKQDILLNKIQNTMLTIERVALSQDQQLDYDLIQYHIALNQQRLILEKRWWQRKPDVISDQGLQALPYGAQWYAYYLKKWVDLKVDPNQLYAFGLKEVERVYAHLLRIQKESGMSAEVFDEYIKSGVFLTDDVNQLQKTFEFSRSLIDEKLPEYFPFLDLVPRLKIARGIDKNYAQTPAYYRDKTLYYNVFDKPYNRRQVEWIYLHEAMPGHHYQLAISEKLSHSKFQNLSWHSGYTEGWGAYVEDIGQEYGFYSDVYDELGKWEWDIIRSVRVVLDVGLNYYGWNDEKALAYWQQYIVDQDDIAAREIARMKRWPAQVITYKYGAQKFMQWKKTREKQANFSLFEFHKSILQQGSMPLSVLELRVNQFPLASDPKTSTL